MTSSPGRIVAVMPDSTASGTTRYTPDGGHGTSPSKRRDSFGQPPFQHGPALDHLALTRGQAPSWLARGRVQ